MESDPTNIIGSDYRVISIHALRMESDKNSPLNCEELKEISIHALRMESDWKVCRPDPHHKKFLSTLSAWRATLPSATIVLPSLSFLSTLSAWRATVYYVRNSALDDIDFYPRSPHGERRASQI